MTGLYGDTSADRGRNAQHSPYRWLTPPEMLVGQLVEIPVDDDGPPRWCEIAVLMPPGLTLEHRWAINVRFAGLECWLKVAPWLRFRVLPTGRDPDPDGGTSPAG